MINQTPFYPKRKLAIEVAFKQLDRELLTRWSFMTAMPHFSATNCEGWTVNYGGGKFEGSPREVFWGGFFEPDIKKVVTDQIERTLADCEIHLDLAEVALDETHEFLREFVRKVYQRLSDIDRRLRGEGYPERVQPRSVEDKVQMMEAFMIDHIEASKRLASQKKWGNLSLEQEHRELLASLVEAIRNVPQQERESIRVTQDRSKFYLEHRGFRGHTREVYFPDLQVLADEKLIDLRHGGTSNVWLVDVRPRGASYYINLKKEMGQPVQRVEAELRHHIDSVHFRGSYPEAFQKWTDAEELLWTADSYQQLTTVGHYCREAMQEFADVLTQRYKPPDANPDKTKTAARITKIFDLYSTKFGDKENAYFEALLAYWGTVADLTQRQEHGGQKEGRPLVWEDARRVVFQTLLVMFEIDRALS
jgi:hypothetical protein